MRISLCSALLMLAAVAHQAWGAEANELSTSQSIRINASPEAVWAVAGDFNGLPRWLSAIVKSEIVVGENNRVGAIRLLSRRNGTHVREKIIAYDSHQMRLAYTYADGEVMASDYFPVLTVKDAGDGTSLVEWTAHFKRVAYWMDPPPEGQDDQSMLNLYNKIYKTGLESLKRFVEGEQ